MEIGRPTCIAQIGLKKAITPTILGVLPQCIANPTIFIIGNSKVPGSMIRNSHLEFCIYSENNACKIIFYNFKNWCAFMYLISIIAVFPVVQHGMLQASLVRSEVQV
jgi:hypothetical protein